MKLKNVKINKLLTHFLTKIGCAFFLCQKVKNYIYAGYRIKMLGKIRKKQQNRQSKQHFL